MHEWVGQDTAVTAVANAGAPLAIWFIGSETAKWLVFISWTNRGRQN